MADYVMTAQEFVDKLNMCADLPSLYVKGGFGHSASDRNKERLINQYSYNARRANLINAASRDTFFYDCVGLGKAIAWGFEGDPDQIYGGAVYKSNGVPDEDETAMMNSCYDITTDFSEVALGEALGIEGHIGFYVGNGKAIECTPSWADGVQRTWVANIVGYKQNEPDRLWTRHGKLPFIDYGTQPTPPEPPKPPRVAEDGWWGTETTFALQEILGCTALDGIVSRQPNGNKRYLPNASASSWEFKGWPFYLGGSAVVKALQQRIGADADGYFGRGSVTALQQYLKDRGYYAGLIDGSLGPATVSGLQMWINAQ